jgi:hypothetical protein
MPTYHINPVVRFDKTELELVREALRPYRVYTGETGLQADEFAKVIRQIENPLNYKQVTDLRVILGLLTKALREDSLRWSRASIKAGVEPKGLFANPKRELQTLVDIREQQITVAGAAGMFLNALVSEMRELVTECNTREMEANCVSEEEG